MNCPFCSHRTDVIDSRESEAGAHFIRRRRVCQSAKCGMRFTTVEVPTISRRSADDITQWIGGRKKVTKKRRKQRTKA